MKTDIRTDGFGGGFTDAKTMRLGSRAASMVRLRSGQDARSAGKKDARPKLQLRTGASNCGRQLTKDSIALMPRCKRWGLYAFAALLVTGIAPMSLAALLIGLCDYLGAWIAFPIAFAAGCALWRVVRP